MTNPSNRLTRIRAGGPIGPADAEWLLGEVERLQMRLKRHEPVSLYNGHDIDWWKAEAERLRGNLSLAEEGLANYALEVERLQSNQREHIQEITELTQNRDDYKADYLRIHKQFVDLKYPDTVPAHEPGAGVSFDEHDRYKRCLYRANGRLIQLGQEPEKLDYPSTDKCGIAATSGDDVLTPDPTTRPECRTGGVSALPPAPGASRDASSGVPPTPTMQARFCDYKGPLVLREGKMVCPECGNS